MGKALGIAPNFTLRASVGRTVGAYVGTAEGKSVGFTANNSEGEKLGI